MKNLFVILLSLAPIILVGGKSNSQLLVIEILHESQVVSFNHKGDELISTIVCPLDSHCNYFFTSKNNTRISQNDVTRKPYVVFMIKDEKFTNRSLNYDTLLSTDIGLIYADIYINYNNDLRL